MAASNFHHKQGSSILSQARSAQSSYGSSKISNQTLPIIINVIGRILSRAHHVQGAANGQSIHVQQLLRCRAANSTSMAAVAICFHHQNIRKQQQGGALIGQSWQHDGCFQHQHFAFGDANCRFKWQQETSKQHGIFFFPIQLGSYIIKHPTFSKQGSNVHFEFTGSIMLLQNSSVMARSSNKRSSRFLQVHTFQQQQIRPHMGPAANHVQLHPTSSKFQPAPSQQQ
ncbi:hypothetical protein ACLOJK_015244, partial [Asimina triloba]